MTISVEIINQLNDNYSYLISSNENNSGIIIDPAESNKILEVLKKKQLNLNYIFITHYRLTVNNETNTVFRQNLKK